jgi:hypothetical protein
MSNRTPDKFSLIVPDDQEPERDMPARLEIMDEGPGGKPRAKRPLGAGAYDPYAISGSPGDTARMRKPRVDLRKLSEWIKTTQQTRALKEEEAAASAPPAARPRREDK